MGSWLWVAKRAMRAAATLSAPRAVLSMRHVRLAVDRPMLGRVARERLDRRRVAPDSGQRAQAVRENAEHHGRHDRKPDGRFSRQLKLLLEKHQAEHDGREPARAEPAHEEHARAAQPRTAQRDRHRQQADQRQTQDAIEHDRHAELRPDLRRERTEQEKDEEIEQLSPVLGELDAVPADLAEPQPRRQPGDEGGDEHARAAHLRREHAGDRQRHDAKLRHRLGDRFLAAGEREQPAAREADTAPDQRAVAELLTEKAEQHPLPQNTLACGRGQRDEEQQERHREPVVQSGLDVQRLADALRDAPTVHDDLPQTGVGRREYRSEDPRLPPAEVAEYRHGAQPAEQEGQEHAGTEQTNRQIGPARQHAWRDARGIDEQRHYQPQLGDQQKRFAVERQLGQGLGRKRD